MNKIIIPSREYRKTNFRRKIPKWLPRPKNSNSDKILQQKFPDLKIPIFAEIEQSITPQPSVVLIGAPPDKNLIALAKAMCMRSMSMVIIIKVN